MAKVFWFTVVALAGLLATQTAATAEPRIGTAVRIVKDVTADARALVTGDGVNQNETVEVRADSLGELKLDDNTKLALGPGARLRLDRFVYDPSQIARRRRRLTSEGRLPLRHRRCAEERLQDPHAERGHLGSRHRVRCLHRRVRRRISAAASGFDRSLPGRRQRPLDLPGSAECLQRHSRVAAGWCGAASGMGPTDRTADHVCDRVSVRDQSADD